ncbi:MAG: regulatory protein GemA [Melioribacteraceae bacterium]|nr:regulatory protein GemA [Melioribacteraceae bacterium]MCF8265833.1 regulatory protein GemA [Melioribacteraceae bacterium]MCF8414529.1 regulatory protein GemA [Melioribacteraceae bacterium]
MRILPVQIKKIKIAQKQLGLTDSQYRDVLSGFNDQNGKPCKSCTTLSSTDANNVLALFEKLGWEQKYKKKLKYSELEGRGGDFASPKSLRKIDAMWHTSPNVRSKTDAAMNKFIKRETGKENIEWISQSDVKKVVQGIKRL